MATTKKRKKSVKVGVKKAKKTPAKPATKSSKALTRKPKSALKKGKSVAKSSKDKAKHKSAKKEPKAKKGLFSFLFKEKPSNVKEKKLSSSKKGSEAPPAHVSTPKATKPQPVKEIKPEIPKELVAEGSYDPEPFRGSSFVFKKNKVLTAEGWKRRFEE